VENDVIADILCFGSEHNHHFDGGEDIMPATLNIANGQDEMGFFMIVYFIITHNFY
jgi:hypothetical protein